MFQGGIDVRSGAVHLFVQVARERRKKIELHQSVMVLHRGPHGDNLRFREIGAC